MEENHPVILIDAIIEKLDLTEIYEDYSKEGNPAYHPRMMMKILFYAYYCRIMSSRTIWQNVINRCNFLFLAAGLVSFALLTARPCSLGWIQHFLRGFKKAKGEFLLIRIVQNISCMIKHRADEIWAWAEA